MHYLCESLSAHPSLLCLPARHLPHQASLINATPRLSSGHAACPPTTNTSSCDLSTTLPLSSSSHS